MQPKALQMFNYIAVINSGFNSHISTDGDNGNTWAKVIRSGDKLVK